MELKSSWATPEKIMQRQADIRSGKRKALTITISDKVQAQFEDPNGMPWKDPRGTSRYTLN